MIISPLASLRHPAEPLDNHLEASLFSRQSPDSCNDYTAFSIRPLTNRRFVRRTPKAFATPLTHSEGEPLLRPHSPSSLNAAREVTLTQFVRHFLSFPQMKFKHGPHHINSGAVGTCSSISTSSHLNTFTSNTRPLGSTRSMRCSTSSRARQDNPGVCLLGGLFQNQMPDHLSKWKQT